MVQQALTSHNLSHGWAPMTHNGSANKNSIAVQQLLFGYDRGHTLLAYSNNLAKRLSSNILSDTDWDTRVSEKVDGYISARPISGEKFYAIMKTWRAPEMPRPGCVWTHALILAEADISRVADLTTIADQLLRPSQFGNFARFKTELKINLTAKATLGVKLNEQLISNLVHRTYSDIHQQVPNEPSEDVELGFLALWSQQWPSLRRRFSFRTAPLAPSRQNATTLFDVEIRQSNQPLEITGNEWENSAIRLVTRDIVENKPSELRKFLWRYGADTMGSRRQLLWLTYLYQQMHLVEENRSKLNDIASEIAHFFPKPEDANLLKTELTQSLEHNFSLLPKIDRFKIIRSVRSKNNRQAFPELGRVDGKAVEDWIESWPAEMGVLLQDCADSEDAFAISLFEGISPKKHKEFLWQLMPTFNRAFVRASKTSVFHLADERIEDIDDSTLLLILKNETWKIKDIKQLVPFLLARDNTELISLVNDIAPEAVTSAVINHVSKAETGLGLPVHPHWIEWIKDNREQIIDFAHNAVKSKSQLLVCRYFLNADTRPVPLATWSQRLGVIENDLSGKADMEFSAFLLIQALRSPGESSDVILQHTFEVVHEALAQNRLGFRIEMHLLDYLPSVGWFNNWDKCLRLRIAVVEVFRQLDLPKKQLLEITTNTRLKNEFALIWSQ